MNTASDEDSGPVRGFVRVGLAWQVVGAMVAVVVFALGLATLLNTLRFQETLTDLVGKRLDVVVNEVANDLQVGLDLGLRIEAMDNLSAIVERQARYAGGGAAIAVYDCTGKPLATAGPGVTRATGSTADDRPPWMPYLDRNHWRHFDDRGIALGMTLKNGYGQCAGGVAIAYEVGTFFETRNAVAKRLRWIALAAALLVLPAAGLLGLMFRHRSRTLHRLCTDLDDIAAGRAASTPPLTGRGPTNTNDGESELIGAYNAARPVLIEAHDTSLLADSSEPVPAPVFVPSRANGQPGIFATVSRWLADPVVQILALTGITLVLALTLVSWFAADALKDKLLPELAHKGMVEAVQAGRTVQRAVDLDIPVDALVGVDALFEGLQRNDPDLAFLALTTPDGRILHGAGMSAADTLGILRSPAQSAVNLSDPRQSRHMEFLVSRIDLHDREEHSLATLHLGHRISALVRPLRESVADVSIVLLVSLFLAFELMLLVVTINITLPVRAALRILRDIATRRFALIHGEFRGDEMGALAYRLNKAVLQGATRLGIVPRPIREPRLAGVRLLAFLFIFAEELARPIMPAFFGQLTATAGGSISSLGAGSVMALHMAVVAVAMPVGSMLYAHIGRRRMYIAGVLLASAGLLGTGLAENLWHLLLWRAISALGYAAAFVACQGFVIESTGPLDRARGAAMMVGGIMLADICGPAIGGIVAAWIGADATFLFGGTVAVFAALSAPLLMGRLADHDDQPPRITFKAFADTLANRRFVAVLVFAAIPAKMILSGLLFYLVPLALAEFDANTAQIGHTLMLYGLAGVLTGPLFARLTDRFQRPVAALALGGIMTAAGAIPLFSASSGSAITLAVLALGIGQSLSIPALVAAALALSQPAVAAYGQGPVMAVLRLLERLGGAAGPLVAAFFSASYGLAKTMGLFGLYSLVSALLLVLAMRLSDRRRRRRPTKPTIVEAELP